jgi:NAD(P)H dehydrogenase (quinone)
MIAVTGATGHLGRLVIAALLKKVPGSVIVGAVRNVEKAKDIAALGVQVRYADYNQPLMWDDALKGVDNVLLISSNELGQRVRQHRAVIDAAKRAGVKRFAYTSILHADTTPLGLAAEHKATEGLIRASGMPFTLLRNGWYTENYTAGISAVLARGAVYGCAGDGRIAAATRADYAEAAAAVLISEKQTGQVYELAGDTAFTLAELAAEISRQSDKAIGYVNLPDADYKNMLMNTGMPEAVAALITDIDTSISKGALFDDGRQLSKLINRPTTSLAKAVASVMQQG